MATLTVVQRLGIEPFAEASKIELRSNWTEQDLQLVIRAAYRQVLGNAHLMSCDRLISAESLLRQGQMTVQDFVRAIALSELYRQKFFYSTQQVRFIELNYKHLLGRAPYDESEIAYHVDLYIKEGYLAEINSYIDSIEYQDNFGDSIVPYYRGFVTQRGQKTVGYNRIFQLYRGYANSDRAQHNSNCARLTKEVARNLPSPIPYHGIVTTYFSQENRIEQLLAEAVGLNKPKALVRSTPLYSLDAYLSLQRQYEEQAKTIENLEQQLAQLRSVAALGAALTNKWQSQTPPTTSQSTVGVGVPHHTKIPTIGQSDSYIVLQQQVKQQTEAIATLQDQIAQLRPLAAIGDAKLNKWRSRTFSS
ncbi:MAG TPA: photosystem I reaction center subunit XII [Cyanobacteria bacterium UBA8803]|nr:photosystem I reaction center subunit XII [Cyanobacteria bacterium UBA9273]HBL58727.1 photosystem I reaction center subunit XII [Cyanobacteria bacterium UBA8803]